MSEENFLYFFLMGWCSGIAIGYIFWAPMTIFKKAFIDGMTLRFLWNRKKQNGI